MTGHGPGAALVPPDPVHRTRVTSRDGVRLHVEIHGRAAGGVLLASTGSANLIADALAFPFGAFIPPFVMLQHRLLTSATPLGPFSPLTRPLLGYMTPGPDAPVDVEAASADIITSCDRRARAPGGMSWPTWM